MLHDDSISCEINLSVETISFDNVGLFVFTTSKGRSRREQNSPTITRNQRLALNVGNRDEKLTPTQPHR